MKNLDLLNFPHLQKSFNDNDLEKGRKPSPVGTVDKYGYVKQSDGSWKKPKKNKKEEPEKKKELVFKKTSEQYGADAYVSYKSEDGFWEIARNDSMNQGGFVNLQGGNTWILSAGNVYYGTYPSLKVAKQVANYQDFKGRPDPIKLLDKLMGND